MIDRLWGCNVTARSKLKNARFCGFHCAGGGHKLTYVIAVCYSNVSRSRMLACSQALRFFRPKRGALHFCARAAVCAQRARPEARCCIPATVQHRAV